MALQEVKQGSDGLPVIVQGSWSRDKVHFVGYFADIFNAGMKKRWPARAYVDLFAGSGRCMDSDSREEFDGSPRRVLQCPTPPTHFFFNDIEDEFVHALRQRQRASFPAADVSYTVDDCNKAVTEIRDRIPTGALTLAFIDPWSYEVNFDAIETLTKGGPTDLIVTFHTFAIKRNAKHEIAEVDRFLGSDTWREEYFSSIGNVSEPPTYVLIETFRQRLKNRLRYGFFGEPEPIRNTMGAPIYYLLFASRDERGLDFWRKASARTRSGQRRML